PTARTARARRTPARLRNRRPFAISSRRRAPRALRRRPRFRGSPRAPPRTESGKPASLARSSRAASLLPRAPSLLPRAASLLPRHLGETADGSEADRDRLLLARGDVREDRGRARAVEGRHPPDRLRPPGGELLLVDDDLLEERVGPRTERLPARRGDGRVDRA